MLSTAVITTVEETRAVARPLAPVAPAPSLDDIGSLLAPILRDLYRRELRHELYVPDAEGCLGSPNYADRAEARISRQLLASVRGRLRATRRLLSDPQVLSADETPGRRSIMTSPLRDGARGRIGLLVVESAATEPDFTPSDLVALQGVAALVELALQRRDPAAEGARRELDRDAAGRVQRGFMTSSLPPGIGITAHAEYLPAFDVGGDFYWVKHAASGAVSAAIGDVSGNGISAALLMSRVASDFERAIDAGARPADVLASAHAGLVRVESDMFVTAACVQVDPAHRRLRVANAGHVPLVVRRGDGEIFTFGGASGAPLGIGPSDWCEEDLAIERGDVILLVTDGLLEALDHPTGHRGLELLLDTVHAAPHDPQRISARIRADVEEARREHALDDVTWVALQVAR